VKLGVALDKLSGSVEDLSQQLRAVAERHAASQDVYHTGHALSRRFEEVGALLEPYLKSYGQDGFEGQEGEAMRAFAERVRRTMSSLTGRSSKSALLLLRDLRELFVETAGCQIDWTIVRQGAMAARDEGLADVAQVGLDETKRVMKWLTTRIKEASPQVLMTPD
jgi:hypothetical protein